MVAASPSTPMLVQNLAVSNNISVNGCCLAVVAKGLAAGFSASLSGKKRFAKRLSAAGNNAEGESPGNR